MTRKIISISYLKKCTMDNKTSYKREHVNAIHGKFLLTTKHNRRANGRVQQLVSAYDFVINDNVSHNDPFLTFEDGDKMRVYQGGDRTYMLSEARSLIELHDSHYPAAYSKTRSDNFCDYADFHDHYPWPGCP